MPYPITRTITASLPTLNLAFRVVQSIEADNIAGATDRSGSNAIPGADDGVLAARTNDTDGTITLEPGHELVTGRVDLYWSGGKRRGVAGTVTGDSLAITGGAGDNLPVEDQEILAVNPVVEDFNVDGANLDALFAAAEANLRFQIVLTEADGTTEVLLVPLAGPTNSYEWSSSSEEANPLGSNVVGKIYLSHEDTGPRNANAIAFTS